MTAIGDSPGAAYVVATRVVAAACCSPRGPLCCVTSARPDPLLHASRRAACVAVACVS